MPLPKNRPARIRIMRPAPRVGCGEAAPKRTVGEGVEISADVLSDGHETLVAIVRWKPPGSSHWSEAPMRRLDLQADGIRWGGAFDVSALGPWLWQVEAWADRLATWRDELRRKVAFGQTELTGELSEGEALLRQAAARAVIDDQAVIEDAMAVVSDPDVGPTARAEAALDPYLAEVCDRNPDRSQSVRSARLTIDVDPALARFGAWYELFPRSWGGLKGVRTQLPRLAELGFDVLYLPPIHPIGRTNRKGRNNTLVAGADDPGSPWAIGDRTGGHAAVHRELGTVADVKALVKAARQHGIEVALDFAIQCSADHPWLTEHPEWFNRRPDGTLKYAENPPKKYQDIYNVNFDSDAWAELWQALREIMLFWVGIGVRVFRVDNPHTKPLAFWEWLLAEVRREQPEVIFLAEAFTRRPMMQALAKAGFNQSYTYFTWKQARWELIEYVNELANSEEREYFRPNFFVNTPDILTEELQLGGLAKFRSRLVLAATLSPSYGMYSGFESGENIAAGPGSEEYLDSEKFEIKQRSLDGPLLPLVAVLNRIRREHRALQHLAGIRFLDTENDALIAYAKSSGDDAVLCVVNLDAYSAQTGVAVVPGDLGLPPVFEVVDLLTDEHFTWHIGHNYVHLDPTERVAHVFHVVDHHVAV